MATYKLTPDDSLVLYSGNGYFFTGTTAADTLTVDPDTLIYCFGNDGGTPLEFDNRGPWTVSMLGTLWSQSGSGILLDPGVTGTVAENVTVGPDGSVYGYWAGINVGGFDPAFIYANAPVVIKIDGEVGANLNEGIGVYFNTTGTHTVTNTGTVFGYWGVYSEGNANDTITNSGLMAWVSAGQGTNKMVNSNQLEGYTGGDGADAVENNGVNAAVGFGIFVYQGTNSLKNSGTINGLGSDLGYLGQDGNDTITNSGTIFGGVEVDAGTNTLTNTGTIGDLDGLSYMGGFSTDTVTNTSGVAFTAIITGIIELGSGTNTLSNTGLIGARGGLSVEGGNDADTVTNTATGVLTGGVSLWAGLNKLTNNGQIGIDSADPGYIGAGGNDTVANAGIILGAVVLGDGTNTLTNTKTIDGDISAGTGIDTVTNTAPGVISGGVSLGEGVNKLTNSGQIGFDNANPAYVGGGGNDTVANTGVILGLVVLGGGTNVITNSKLIDGDISADSGADTISNSTPGVITGSVSLGDGINKLTNTGSVGVANALAIYGGDIGSDTVTNSKSILGGIDLGHGTNTFTNSGTIGTNAGGVSYLGGDGLDTVVNSGTINGDVHLLDNNDVFTDFSGKVQGRVLGIIELGNGNDKFVGGSNIETVQDAGGADNYALGGGDDVFIATGAFFGAPGIDTIDGGAGSLDMYDASLSTTAVQINLSSTTRFDPNSVVGLTALTATGDNIGTDKLANIEAVAGGVSGDYIFGSDSPTVGNYIDGREGDDDLFGLGGADTLFGGEGSDHLYGGAGKDVLDGSTGGGWDDNAADYFVYQSLSDSGASKTTRDVINNFIEGQDKIDLSAIDADTTAGHFGDDAFIWIGTNALFTHTGGELRAYWTATGQIVEGDVNGDARADFSIELQYFLPDHVLSSSDFIV